MVGGVVAVVAAAGALVNVAATWLAGRADRRGLNVRGVLAHLVTDVWAFAATFVAGLVVLATGWLRADAVATFVVAALMAWTGTRLVHEAGRVFLEAAPAGVDPAELGATLAGTGGVAEVHDLHVWSLGVGETALSAHVLVDPEHDCHEVSGAAAGPAGRALRHRARHPAGRSRRRAGPRRRALRRRARHRPHRPRAVAAGR